MHNVMLDLETMGNKPDAAIVAIGACFFNPLTGEIGNKFEQTVLLTDSAKFGSIDGDTVLWWLKQSDDARLRINDGLFVTLGKALESFYEFVSVNCPVHKVKMWGNGASFDNVILKNAYDAIDKDAPWEFYNDRDVRTIVDLGRTLLNFNPKKDMPFQGTEHNALDDAIHQAKYVSAIIQKLKPTQ